MHLYIHVPFCARRCSYCDFAIAVRRETPSQAFADALIREWSGWQEHPGWQSSLGLDTIYFGGGTPSRLSPETLGLLIRRFRADREVTSTAEVTLEANPDDVTPSNAEAWARAGINRVSLGAQSFSESVLEWMHRTHDAAQIGVAVRTLRAAGIQNVSLDLIYGLPASLGRDWALDLDRAFGLDPWHLSLYALTIERGTPAARWTARGELVPLADDLAAEEFLVAHQRLEQAGFDHYEVSNAARPGQRARHNSGYWKRRPFIGLGPSAHSGFGVERRWNVREWEDYRRRSESGQSVVAESERLSEEQIVLEQLYLGLRTTEGVERAHLNDKELQTWQREGWALADSDRVRLTPEGWLRLDALVASLTRC